DPAPEKDRLAGRTRSPSVSMVLPGMAAPPAPLPPSARGARPELCNRERAMAESAPDPEAMPVERIRHHEDVREELQKAAPPAPRTEPKPGRSRFVRLVLYGVSALALGALAGALERQVLPVGPVASHRLAQISLAAALVLALLAIHRGAALLVWARVRSKVARYNLLRGLRFASMLAIFLAVASVFFANWYATAVSFGLVSLILGLALQAPITSFFAWIYILVRKPYRVG